MNFTVTEGLLIIVIFQLFFIGIFLFTHEKGKRISNIFLGLFFISIAFNLLDSLLILERVYEYSSLWVAWGSCFPLLFGPLLYLYTRSLLYKNFKLSGRNWLHFLPFLLSFVATEGSYLMQTEAFRQTMIQNLIQRKIPVYVYWATGIIFVQFFLYVWACFRMIGKYKKIAGDQFSDEQRNNISWLSSTILFFTICMILSALNGFTSLTRWSEYFYLLLTVIIFGIFVFINRVLIKALKRPEIFALMEQGGGGENSTQQGSPRYAGSTLQSEERQLLLEKLQKYMNEAKPYLEPELSLEQLAGSLSIRPRILSQLINESLQQNFFDFINRFRIEEAKRLLTNPPDKKITILEVLYQVGFNSKSSFNTLFKKHTGLTPSEFKQKHSS